MNTTTQQDSTKAAKEFEIARLLNSNATHTVSGASDGIDFSVTIPLLDLLAFFGKAAELAEDSETEGKKSPGGFPTALFTAMLPADRRAAAGWDITKDGWDYDKALATFQAKLVRKTRAQTPEQKAKAAATREATKQAAALAPKLQAMQAELDASMAQWEADEDSVAFRERNAEIKARYAATPAA